MRYAVPEAGERVGYALLQWAHVWMFSTRRKSGWCAPGWNKPNASHYRTGGGLVENYLAPLAMRTPQGLTSAPTPASSPWRGPASTGLSTKPPRS